MTPEIAFTAVTFILLAIILGLLFLVSYLLDELHKHNDSNQAGATNVKRGAPTTDSPGFDC